MNSRRTPRSAASTASARHFISRRDFVATGASLIITPVLMTCASTPTGAPEGENRLTARPGVPTEQPTLGLTELGIGDFRDGNLYVPSQYSADTPAPLFVGLHGAGGDADDWASYPDRAEARNMVFMAIDSRGNTWDGVQGIFGPDVVFLDQALRYTFDRVRIDASRIALGGFSDGASYALSLGVSNGDLFTHLIAYSPGFIQAADPIVGKPLVYISHGNADPILPKAETSDRIVPALRDDGYQVVYNEFDGGHEVPAAVSDDALDWFTG